MAQKVDGVLSSEMDSVKATKSHFAISNSDWAKMSSDEKEYLRKLSHTHLSLGIEARIERALKKENIKKQEKNFTMIGVGLIGGLIYGMLKK